MLSYTTHFDSILSWPLAEKRHNEWTHNPRDQTRECWNEKQNREISESFENENRNVLIAMKAITLVYPLHKIQKKYARKGTLKYNGFN